jgi:hypothetical protein
MKSMRRIVQSPGKAKKQQERARRTDAFIDAIMEDLKQMPVAERQEIVDLFSSLVVREKEER